MSREWEVVKSTVDKVVRDAVAAGGLTAKVNVASVDDTADFESVLQDAKDAVLYQVARLSPDPRAPKFELTFNVGAKTTDDGGSFDMSKILGALGVTFFIGARHSLHDYSGAVASEQRGALLITHADVMPQQFDKQSGIRMMSCRAAVICRGG